MGIKNLYNNNLLKYAKDHRQKQTPAVKLLWKHIKSKKLSGVKFKRQQILLNYIIDFYSFEYKLAIEIDGSSHDEYKYEYDLKRQLELESLGIKFLRFTEYEVNTRLKDTLETTVRSLSLGI